MDAKSVTVIIAAGISLFIGIWVVSAVSSGVTLPAYTALNESYNFAVNDTYYAPANTPIKAVTSMWDSPAHTNLYDPAFYTYTTSGIKIYTNSSVGGYPNMTAGTKYFDYTYNSASAVNTFNTTEGIVWNAIQLLSVVLIITAAGVILAYFGFGRKD